ncbi:MAG: type 3 dihydrofolate reductase [Coxiella sp. (in: Bacteria)]|nr:MAG: type 3 dihydrofolate reductase [Coxiella sp. (in: g-proteobacteria)]
MISLIVAMSKNRVIGNEGKIPWHLPNDFKHFKQVTLGKPIIMGRKTHESIGRPLPGRRNIVVTRQSDYLADGCDVFQSIDAALDAVASEPEIMIIGGSTLYEQTLERADRIYLTIVDTTLDGDAYFPELDPEHWQLLTAENHPSDATHQYDYTFQTLQRDTF